MRALLLWTGLVLCATGAAAQTAPDITSSRGPLSLDVYASAYLGTSDAQSVLVGVEIRGLNTSPVMADRRLEVGYATASDPAAPVMHAVSVPMRDAAAVVMSGGVVRVLTRLAIMPGNYELRVTVRDSLDGRTGAVVHPLEVPIFTAGTDVVSMSGVMITSSAVGGHTFVDPDEEYAVHPILLQPPAARRQFSQNELVEVLAEIYEQDGINDFDLGSSLTIYTRVIDAAGKVVFETSDLGTSETLPNGRWGYQHWQLVQIRDLPPGDYVLQVGATINDASAWRSAPITILPAQ